MSISLAGSTQAQIDCIHYWNIVGIHDINTKTNERYGNRTPGKCRKCNLERMFSSVLKQYRKEDFTV